MQSSDYFSPKLNDGKHIFVFGSNYAGRHGLGAAYTAKTFWGARMFQGMGRTGQAYAIPTKTYDIKKSLPLDKIKAHVEDFIEYAKSHPELIFLVTKIGCGLAGYKEEQIKPFFKNAPENCILPINWRNL